MSLSPQQMQAFLSETRMAVVATIDRNGQPHAVPTWYEYDSGSIVFHTGISSHKYANLRRDPRLTFCIEDRTLPYKAVIVKGRAEMEERTDDERTRRMAVRYLGEAIGNRYADGLKGSVVVVVRVLPERVISWDYGQGDNP